MSPRCRNLVHAPEVLTDAGAGSKQPRTSAHRVRQLRTLGCVGGGARQRPLLPGQLNAIDGSPGPGHSSIFTSPRSSPKRASRIPPQDLPGREAVPGLHRARSVRRAPHQRVPIRSPTPCAEPSPSSRRLASSESRNGSSPTGRSRQPSRRSVSASVADSPA